jgi:D-alanine transaminase
MPNIAYVNGRYLPLSRATVSVEDRGFQFGDGIYELIRTYDGRIFQLDYHLRRLRNSAEAIGLKMPYPAARWKFILAEMNRRCGYRSAKLYIQITRGTAPRNHPFPENARPTVVLTARRLDPLPDRLVAKGAEVITVSDLRWGRCDIKSVNLLANVLARQKAKTEKVNEALFVRDGRVTEGSSSNVFIVINGRVCTTPTGPGILPGVTRDLVIRIAKTSGFQTVERELPVRRLFSADEVFLTGTTVEVLPVVRIDGRRIGNGKPGRITESIARSFRRLTGG